MTLNIANSSAKTLFTFFEKLEQDKIFISLFSTLNLLTCPVVYLIITENRSGRTGGFSPPVFAKFLQNLPFSPQILEILCLPPPYSSDSPRTFKFTPTSLIIHVIISSKDTRSDDQITGLILQGCQIAGFKGNEWTKRTALHRSARVKYRVRRPSCSFYINLESHRN